MRPPPMYNGEELEAGFFPIPHYILQVCNDGYDLRFLTVLAKCENRWGGNTEGWFYISDGRLAKMCKMGTRHVGPCRRKSAKKGLLEFELGDARHETRYHLTWASAKLKTEV